MTTAARTGGLEAANYSPTSDYIYIHRWNYKCCFAEATCYHDCHFTPYINDYDEPMDYSVQVSANISRL